MAEQFTELVQILDSSNNVTIALDANAAALYIGASGKEGILQVLDGSGQIVFDFDSTYAELYLGGQGNEGDLIVRDETNKERIKLDGGEGDIWIKNQEGNTLFHFDSTYAALYLGGLGNEGDLIVRNSSGNETIRLDGESGDIILTNADAAEHFDVDDMESAQAGTVMVLDHNGKLKPCSTPYDKKVVGVVSGAGNYRPGIILDRKNEVNPRAAISILGKVSCKADTTYGAIEVGDLLTTSPTSGHAMKAGDAQKAFGAVIGKALTPLAEGTGLVDLLITLQ